MTSPFADSLVKALFGVSPIEAQKKKVCVFCEKPAIEFRDKLSEREYTISGMCQDCQDETFGI